MNGYINIYSKFMQIYLSELSHKFQCILKKTKEALIVKYIKNI